MKDGRVVVRAPSRARQSDIDKFIFEKQSWLTSKLAAIENNKNTYYDVMNYSVLLFLGAKYSLCKWSGKKIAVGENFSILVPNGAEDSKILSMIKTWYRKQAKDILFKRTQEIASKLKLFPQDLKINDSKGRWGACNNKNVITFNWRVVMLPPAIIDYVIVHELCHMVEFNHSKKFWSLVQTFLSDAKQRREKIKEYGFLLEMFKRK